MPLSRSEVMRRIRAEGTKPETWVADRLLAWGVPFRQWGVDLPGRPDFVFDQVKVVLFVHGCFWHRHDCGKARTEPKTNEAFWRAKFEANVRRDAEASRSLEAQGWQVLTLWECQVWGPATELLAQWLAEAHGVDHPPGEGLVP